MKELNSDQAVKELGIKDNTTEIQLLKILITLIVILLQKIRKTITIIKAKEKALEAIILKMKKKKEK